MRVFFDYVISRLLVIYLMLRGATFLRLLNLVISMSSMVLKRPTSGKVPPELIIKVTSRCNYACIMCPKTSPTLPYYDHPEDLPFHVLERLLRTNARYLSLIKLFGGEPLYHRDIGRILDLLNELELKFTITTNAYLLTPEISRRLVRNCVRVFVSIDSADPQTYRAIRRGGDLGRLVANLGHLQETLRETHSSAPIIKAIMTVFSFNLADMPGMVRFCADHGIRYLVFQEGVPYGNPGVEKAHLLRENVQYTELMIRRTREEGRQRRVVLEFDFPWFRQSTMAASSQGQALQGTRPRNSWRCFYLYFTMLIQQNSRHTFCFGTYDHLTPTDDREISDIWNAPDGPYYQGRLQLKHHSVPEYCRAAYRAGGKCALTMVRGR